MFRDMVRVLGGEIEETQQLSRYHVSPTSPIFKGAYLANLTEDESEGTIRETIAWFKERNAPFFFWWPGQDTQPVDLGERLVANGFSIFKKDAPAMAAEINALSWDNPRPQELSLHPIENSDQLVQWKQTFIEAFGIPEFAGQAWVDATQAVGIGRTPWHLLLGTLNTEPVCCGCYIVVQGSQGFSGWEHFLPIAKKELEAPCSWSDYASPAT